MPDSKKYHEIAKWVIGTVTCCILIYLCFRHLDSIASAVSWLADMVKPILIGGVMALILNVPMRMFERQIRKRTHMKKGVRGLSIVLALVMVLGIFVLVAVLILPQLVRAITLIAQTVSEALSDLAALEADAGFAQTAVGKFLIGLDIDWAGLQTQLEEFVRGNSSDLFDRAITVTSSLIGWIVTFVLGLVFAIYILGGKEKLKRQATRLVNAWLPEKPAQILIHVCSVCSSTFQKFIGGQATEAVILGTLCMIGMLILRIPYAGMVGALVGVTALLPVVGAYIGAIVGTIIIFTKSPFKALVFLIFLILLQQTENQLIYPRVVGHKVQLPAIWVLAAITVGGNVGGPIGMFLGVPAASAAYALLREATERREHEKSLKKAADDLAEKEKTVADDVVKITNSGK